MCLCDNGKQLKSMVPVGDKLLKAPRNAKELMATRLMEGHHVRCSCRGIQVCVYAVDCFGLNFGGMILPTKVALLSDINGSLGHYRGQQIQLFFEGNSSETFPQ